MPRLIAAAQLVQLGQAESLGPFDRHQRGVGHVDADFDHRGGDQHLRVARGERRPSPRPSRRGVMRP